ncbi:MAG TPA: filamentous hemagglutinin N-terminal domain-containing protein, partial [Pseudomonadales bacterium]
MKTSLPRRHRHRSAPSACAPLAPRPWLFAMLSLPLAVQQAMANPQGGTVVAGSASLHSSGNTLTVQQQTQRAIINWQSFDIAGGETTRFVQPDSSSAVLNRVNSGNPSAIYGTLKANGHVYLINPNGVVVGSSGVINTRSFVASTLDVANAEFLAGDDLRFVGDSHAAVINLGHIEAAGGDVFLIAHKVVNEGEILAAGDAGLAAGSEVVLQAAGDQRISIKVSAENALVDNKGLIEAARVQMQAANNNPYALAINHSGVARATGVVRRGGRIILSADSGATEVAGTLQAAGGEIDVLGDTVQLRDGTRIDVSADDDGGDIRIGGGLQGQGTDKVASDVQVDDNVVIDASSRELGDGGSVIVWADAHASVGGEIFARGGAQGGDGGFVETSGKDSIDFSVTVDASAPQGESGTWL